MVRLLIRRGAQVNRHDPESGSTPLLEAAVKGHVDVASVLLEAGADPNAADKAGSTPLDEALRFKHTKMVELLMAHGAKPAGSGDGISE